MSRLTGPFVGSAAFADEVAAAPAVAANTAAVARVAPINDPGTGLQLRQGFGGTIQWLRGPHVNLADVLDPVAANHVAALKSTIDAHGAGYTYHIPAGMDVKVPLTLIANAPHLPKQTRIHGEGPASRILVTGQQPDPGGTYCAFRIDAADAEDVAIRDLTVQGDGAGAAQTWSNGQALVFSILPLGAGIMRVRYERVIFRDHNVCPVNGHGSQLQTFVEECAFINCGNGANENGDFAVYRNNWFQNSEGIESSSAGAIIEGNIFLDIFATAISAGGNTQVGARPGSRIVNNQIFGVRGGTGLGGGVGIITAQSSPDLLIAGNYIERTYGTGLSVNKYTGYGPDDGATIANNHLVNCTATANTSHTAAIIQAANARVLGNRIYNRTALAGDPYPLTGYAAQFMLQLAGDNALVVGNTLDASNGGVYAVDFNGATNTRWGKNSTIAGVSGQFQVRNGATFADAELLGDQVTIGGAAVNATVGHKLIVITTPGVTRNVNLPSATGLTGKRLTVVVTNGASNTVTVTPNGTQTINGVSAAKTLSSNYASIALLSDGANWIIVNQTGTVA